MRATDVPSGLVEILAKRHWGAMRAADKYPDGWPTWESAEGPLKDRIVARTAVDLSLVLPLAYAEAIEHVAKRISPNSGIGLADGATRGDVAVWLLEYAAELRGNATEGTSA